MNVYQFLPNLVKGDAISNHTVQIMKILKLAGYNSETYVQYFSEDVSSLCKHYKNFIKKSNTSDDIIIYHHSIGCEISDFVFSLKGKKIMIYHNITPNHFFRPFNESLYMLCKKGEEHLGDYTNMVDLALGDSLFNTEELKKAGYKNTNVLPILVDFSDFLNTLPNQNIIKQYREDDYVNFIFVGRVSPHKKQEDIIMAFNHYNKIINHKSRLFIVGSYEGMESYYNMLINLVSELNADNVYFTGKVGFDELVAYYSIADIFLCMSEHEGFCVPLLECMYFNIPIIAYNIPAIQETLNRSGMIVTEKRFDYIAELANLILCNEELKSKVIERQKSRLGDFSIDKVSESLLNYIKDVTRIAK